ILIFVIQKWMRHSTCLKSIALAAISLIAVIWLVSLFNYKILDATKSEPSRYMMLDDLSYLSLVEKKSLIPGWELQDIQDCSINSVGQNKLVGKIFCLKQKPNYQINNPLKTDLHPIWKDKISQNPIAYIQYRLAAFVYL